MSTSNRNHLASVAAAVVAGVAMFGLLSPAAASDQNNPAGLTSHSPWLAPIGHRILTSNSIESSSSAAAAEASIPERNRV
jgi:hypothetical protein